MQDAGDGLGDLFPTGTVTERAISTEAADGDVNEARAQRCKLFGPEAELRERARPIPLREHVRLLDERLQARGVLGVRQIEKGAALAVIGVDDMFGDLRQVLRRN